MTYGIVYYWHCSKTNMGYVGQTIDTLSGRWKGHVRSALNPKSRTGHWEFPKAIREHGVDAFVGRVLCECDNPEELSVMEDRWMHELNTLWPNGYNMRDGTNFICDQTRQYISQRTREAMAKDDSWKERQRQAMKDSDVKRLISERTCKAMQRPEVQIKLRKSRDNGRKGYRTPDDVKKKISETLKARRQSAAC